jgi:hypothetical protein
MEEAPEAESVHTRRTQRYPQSLSSNKELPAAETAIELEGMSVQFVIVAVDKEVSLAP